MSLPASLPFVVIAKGLPPLGFQVVDGGFIVADLPNPAEHSLLTFSLTEAIPTDKSRRHKSDSVCLYYSLPPFDNMSFLTALANQRPR